MASWYPYTTYHAPDHHYGRRERNIPNNNRARGDPLGLVLQAGTRRDEATPPSCVLQGNGFDDGNFSLSRVAKSIEKPILEWHLWRNGVYERSYKKSKNGKHTYRCTSSSSSSL